MNRSFRALAPVSLAALGSQAFAAVPADVTTALTDMKVDASSVAVTVLVAIIVVMAIKFIRRGM